MEELAVQLHTALSSAQFEVPDRTARVYIEYVLYIGTITLVALSKSVRAEFLTRLLAAPLR